MSDYLYATQAINTPNPELKSPGFDFRWWDSSPTFHPRTVPCGPSVRLFEHPKPRNHGAIPTINAKACAFESSIVQILGLSSYGSAESARCLPTCFL